MTHKDQLLEAIKDEFKIIKHLYTKIPEGKLEFKPAEEMRTVFQLLRYFTWCGLVTLKTFIEGEEDSPNFGIYKELSEAAQNFKPENFNDVMDEQLNSINKLFEKFSDEDLLSKKVMMPFGDKLSLGEAIIKTTVKHMTAYRMQLFLYLKILGVEVNTVNCWIGEDESED
ncbi:MAG: ClbS/DfsB family four-helix bundle protein [Ignavibacteria bacterium]|nr:ClbS/DfsB family four-helix bundle protein [Ignavibacteria bacterium]